MYASQRNTDAVENQACNKLQPQATGLVFNILQEPHKVMVIEDHGISENVFLEREAPVSMTPLTAPTSSSLKRCAMLSSPL